MQLYRLNTVKYRPVVYCSGQVSCEVIMTKRLLEVRRTVGDLISVMVTIKAEVELSISHPISDQREADGKVVASLQDGVALLHSNLYIILKKSPFLFMDDRSARGKQKMTRNDEEKCFCLKVYQIISITLCSAYREKGGSRICTLPHDPCMYEKNIFQVFINSN